MGRGRAPATAFRVAIAAGFLLALTANLPGHLTTDSVVALVEARTGIRQTWAPAIASWLLRPFDSLAPGTGLYVTACAALCYLSLMSLPGLRPKSSWLGAGLALAAVFLPQLLIYQGIVWRDVLFANLVVAGFVMLAHAARRGQAAAWPLLAGAFACLAVATLARQNGAILLLAAAAALAWTRRDRGWPRATGWALAALVAAGLLAVALDRAAQPQLQAGKLRPGAAVLILQHYDIIGAKAHHPKLRFDVIGRANPAAEARLEAEGPRLYSAARVDTLDSDPVFRRTLWRLPDPVMQAQWREVVLHHPAAYLLHRADAFRWVLATPQLEMCLPVAVGVSGPADLLADLEVETGIDIRDQALADYAHRFYGTPVFSHLAYLALALVLIGLFLRRGEPQDQVMAALLAGSLLFVASFAVISVACDYRYLYLLDLAAITAGLYAALDPPFGRGQPRASRRSA